LMRRFPIAHYALTNITSHTYELTIRGDVDQMLFEKEIFTLLGQSTLIRYE